MTTNTDTDRDTAPPPAVGAADTAPPPSSSPPPPPASSSSSSRRVCPVCSLPGIKICAGCSKVGYCSKEHQIQHWKEHKLVCAQKHKLLGPSSSASSSSSSSSAVSTLSRPDEVTVTWSDQQQINLFSRLNTHLSVVDDQLKQIEKEYANVVDAVDAIETLVDDDSVMIKIGEVFVKVSNDEAEAWIAADKKRQSEKKQQFNREKEEIQAKMKELKTTLYGKFGKAINLENAEQTIND